MILDGTHATLVAAALVDGLMHVEVVAAWDGHGCTRELREQVPAIVARVAPYSIGWMPNGPAAAITAEMAENKRGGVKWPPRGVLLEPIVAALPAVCMGLAELTAARQVRHPRDPLLDAHVNAAARSRRGDAWIFGRIDSGGPIDAVYAAAGAAHLARVMPPPRPALTAL